MRFLRAGDKVKITIMFRGREQHRPELGFRLLQRLAEDVEELGFVESSPKQDGRNMIMVLGPHKKKAEAKAELKAEKAEKAAAHEAELEEERRSTRRSAAAAATSRRPSQAQAAVGEPRPRHVTRRRRRPPARRGEKDNEMPKNKTHSGASKRFRVTGSGKLRRQKAGLRHNLEKKPSTMTRRMSGTTEVSKNDTKTVRKLLGR